MPQTYNLIEFVLMFGAGLFFVGFMSSLTNKKGGDYLKKVGDLLKVFKGQWKFLLGIFIGYLIIEGTHSKNWVLMLTLLLGLWGTALGVSAMFQKLQNFWDWSVAQAKKNWIILLGVVIGLFCSTITFTFT